MTEMISFQARVEETVAWLSEEVAGPPEIILMLGTGLGGLAGEIEDACELPYADVPHFPRSTVISHAGNLIVGRLMGKRIAVLQGRFHFYEGYSTRELTLPVRALALFGAKSLIVSNAAGGLNPDYRPGTLMVIRDHINMIPGNPLRGSNVDTWGPRFPDMSQAYDREFMDLSLGAAKRLQLGNVTSGVYVAVAGPSLETPAETRFLRNIGADAVGMSTVPEVIVARHAGLRVLGVSVIANVNDPDNFKPITVEEVISQTEKASADFQRLLLEVVRDMDSA